MIGGIPSTGDAIQTSDDGGETWTSRPCVLDGVLDVVRSESLGLFVAAGSGGFGFIAYSSDGIAWTANIDLFGIIDNAICVVWDESQGLFVAGFEHFSHNLTAKTIATSTDGIAWTPATTDWEGAFAQVSGIVYSAALGLWIATGIGGGTTPTKTLLTSLDASTWTTNTPGPFDGNGGGHAGEGIAISQDGLTVIAVGINVDDSAVIGTSTDLTTWTPVSTGLDGSTAHVIVVSPDLILVGGNGGILESADGGATWTFDSSPLDTGAIRGFVFAADSVVGSGRTSDHLITTILAAPPPPPPTVQAFADLPVRVFITDLNTETITIMDRRATDKQFLFTLNAPAYHTGQVASDDPEVNTAFPLVTSQANLAQASRLCYALQRQKGSDPPYQPIFGGIVTIIEDQGTDAPTTRYTAHDPWQYMMSRPARDPDTLGLIPAAGYTYPTGTRASHIATEQLLLTAGIDGETHIDTGGTSFPLVEDTDPLPAPFTIDAGMSVGEVWTALTETGTIDIHLPPIYDPDSRPGKVVEFQTVRQSDVVAAGPVRYDIVMAWDRPGNSLMGINNLIDATRLANKVQFWTDNGAVPLQTDAASVAVYGEYWAQQTFPGTPDPLIIALLAVASAVERRNGARTISFDPAPERVEQPFKDYNLGDYLPVWASRNLRQPLGVDYDSFDADNPGASGYQRIYAIPLTVDDNGVSRVTGLLTSKEN